MKNFILKHSSLKKISSFNILIIFSFQLWGSPIQTNVTPLKTVYKNDFYIGCLLSYRHIGFSSDPVVPGQSAVLDTNGGYLIKFHMNSMSPGNNMKTAYTVDLTASAAAYTAAATPEAKDSIDKHPIVRFNGDLIAQLNWAKRQGFTFRGHTLVWHASAPTAFFRSGYTDTGTRLTKEVMQVRMENYIEEVIRLIHENWSGLLSAIDVVNEAVNDNGTFRTNSEWYTTFGDSSFVIRAFEYARKYTVQYGETQIKLYYNDYNTDNPAKADGIVKLVTPIYEGGYLDGIGMQEHNSLTSPGAANFIASYDKFYPVCTEMAVTELDVNTGSGTNTPSASVLEAQANQYANLFKCFVERSYFSGRGKIINVSKDGLNDQYTFITNQATSLWDTRDQSKPAFYAVMNVGLDYNRLDTLIRYAQGLNQSDYTVEEWANIQTALSYAQNILATNYSSTVSAVSDLEKAISYILDPSQVIYIGIKEIQDKIIMSTYNNVIHLNNLPGRSKISVVALNGTIIQMIYSTSNSLQIPFKTPCIVSVSYGNEVKSFKVFQGK